MKMVVLNPQEPDVTVRSVSAFDFAAATMLVALGLFYFWRGQDGSQNPEVMEVRHDAWSLEFRTKVAD